MSQAANLILEDATVEITIGAMANGQAPDFSSLTSASIMGILRRARINASVQKTNVKGAGNSAVRYRYHSHERTMEIESFVSSDGYTFADVPANGTLEGHYIRIRTKEISSLAANREWVGVIETWNWEGRVAGEQVETATIGLNPDYDIA